MIIPNILEYFIADSGCLVQICQDIWMCEKHHQIFVSLSAGAWLRPIGAKICLILNLHFCPSRPQPSHLQSSRQKFGDAICVLLKEDVPQGQPELKC